MAQKASRIIEDIAKKMKIFSKNTETKEGGIDYLFDTHDSQNEKVSHISLDAYEWDEEGVIAFVNDMFLAAIAKNASDIHIDPQEREIKVRFRIDGIFVPYKTLEKKMHDTLIARIKILSYLRIDEHRLPQDGKIHFTFFGGKSVDLRISIMPTIYGEKCVVRILKKEVVPPELKDLGILPYNLVKIKKHLSDSFGMILAVWPTGSGKSTTLFSLLSHFNAFENNICTLEDPVEYRIPWVNHTQIFPAIGFDFATGLRALLRQDPDIIMVGEIRDEETAKLAIEASITWHLVFSTLHTNSAIHTIGRLLYLGIDPFLLASALRLVISQRLVRRLCPNCKKQITPDEYARKLIVWKIEKYLKDKEHFPLFVHAEWGCEQCNFTWFKGRIGIFEILEITDKIGEMILSKASNLQLEIAATAEGMVSIAQDAFLKVVLGETSLDEVLSVIEAM